jgi:hypothetical protein
MPWPHSTPGKDKVPIVQVGPRAGLDRSGNLAHTVIRSPDLPARSQSLYRLSYPTHNGQLFRHQKKNSTLGDLFISCTDM